MDRDNCIYMCVKLVKILELDLSGGVIHQIKKFVQRRLKKSMGTICCAASYHRNVITADNGCHVQIWRRKVFEISLSIFIYLVFDRTYKIFKLFYNIFKSL